MASKGPYLVLFEDMGAIRQIRTENTHMLSTAGFLRGLEECGVIPDAEEFIQKKPYALDENFPTDPDGTGEPVGPGQGEFKEGTDL